MATQILTDFSSKKLGIRSTITDVDVVTVLYVSKTPISE
jgi:hypothetical protein